MSDPRAERTRALVFDSVRDILTTRDATTLNFSVVAVEAGVARKTLYAHWDSLARLIGDLLGRELAPVIPGPLAISTEDVLREYLSVVRDQLSQRSTLAALSYLMTSSIHDPDSASALRDLTDVRCRGLGRLIDREVSEEQLSHIFGPLLYRQLIFHEPASDVMVLQIARQTADELR